MKKYLSYALVFSICFIFAIMLNSSNSNYKSANSSYLSDRVNLVIDAGHGGIDAGTIGVDNNNEKDINLDIAKKLYDFAGVSGIKCFLIRDGDYLYYKANDDKKRSDLYNRLDFVNSISKANLISIHQNHFDNEKEWGTQIWYSGNDDKSQILADNILMIVKENLQKENKRLNKKSDNSYYLLYKASVPSVMVECGFMSNIEENKKLQDNTYQNKMAYSIMLGFLEYASKEI